MLVLAPSVVACPNCRREYLLPNVPHPEPRFVWTDGWFERRDGAPVPTGWLQCPDCDAVTAKDTWRHMRALTAKETVPSAREPSPEALRAHLEALLKEHVDAERAHGLRLQLWWLANARRRGAKSPVALEEESRRELFRLLRPPDAPGFEGGLRRVEVLRELGEFDQAGALIREMRWRLNRLEALINQRDSLPQLWDPVPIQWPPEPRLPVGD